MKVLWCLLCNDIRAMDPGGAPTSCRCGNLTARWENPVRGTVRATAKDRESVRFIGMHNGFLRFAATAPAWGDIGNAKWRAEHERICAEDADGYIFSQQFRNCPFAIVKVGTTNDIRWWDDETEVST